MAAAATLCLVAGCAPLPRRAYLAPLARDGSSDPGRERPRGEASEPEGSPDDLARATHAERADALARAGRLEDALAEAEAAVRLAPDDAVAHFRFGLVLQMLGRLDEALLAYRAAARLRPTSPWAHAALAIVHLRLGDAPAALREYRVVRSLDSGLARELLDLLVEEAGLQSADRRAPTARS